jgi:uncharacterized protein with FMN-binding domain
MKKFFLSAFVILTFIFYVLITRSSDYILTSLSTNSSAPAENNPMPASQDRAPVKNAPAAPSVSQPIKSEIIKTPAKSGLYSDGKYIGGSADAYYGNVQIEAIISGGRISDVVFLNYPQDMMHSVAINSYAMPILKAEAIQAQSAQVDTVSGATETSDAFIKSLSSALTQAKN